jgi:hypothetical protein
MCEDPAEALCVPQAEGEMQLRKLYKDLALNKVNIKDLKKLQVIGETLSLQPKDSCNMQFFRGYAI